MLNARLSTYSLRNVQEMVKEEKELLKTDLRLSVTLRNNCDHFAEEIKSLTSLASFKRVKKNWTYNRCPCRFCKTYIQNVSFVKICPSN